MYYKNNLQNSQLWAVSESYETHDFLTLTIQILSIVNFITVDTTAPQNCVQQTMLNGAHLMAFQVTKQSEVRLSLSSSFDLMSD